MSGAETIVTAAREWGRYKAELAHSGVADYPRCVDRAVRAERALLHALGDPDYAAPVEAGDAEAWRDRHDAVRHALWQTQAALATAMDFWRSWRAEGALPLDRDESAEAASYRHCARWLAPADRAGGNAA